VTNWWQGGAVLEHVKRRLALGFYGDGLAVEDEGGSFDFGNGCGDLGELPCEIVSAT
jgi:hypothetical protein